MTDDEVLDWFGHFYEPVLRDEVSTFTHEYAAESVTKIFSRTGEVAKYGNVPPSFVIVTIVSAIWLLVRLGAQRTGADRPTPPATHGAVGAEPARRIG